MTDLSEFSKSCKAMRHRSLPSLNMTLCTHDQVSVNVNAQITHGFHWSDCSALDRHWSSRKLMLTSIRRAPKNTNTNIPSTALRVINVYIFSSACVTFTCNGLFAIPNYQIVLSMCHLNNTIRGSFPLK